MINPNPAIEQKINQFILETQNKFSQDKSATLASYQTEAKTITQETNNLRDELIQKQRRIRKTNNSSYRSACGDNQPFIYG